MLQDIWSGLPMSLQLEMVKWDYEKLGDMNYQNLPRFQKNLYRVMSIKKNYLVAVGTGLNS